MVADWRWDSAPSTARAGRWRIGFQQALQGDGFLGDLPALEVPDLQQPRQLGVEFGQAQDLLHLLADPFVVGDGVGVPGDEQRLQELLEGVVETIEGLEVQPTLDVERDVVQVVGQCHLTIARRSRRRVSS